MKIKVKRPFKYAEDGILVRHYETGVHEVSEACAEIAIAQGWAKKVRQILKKKDQKK